jgi:uncharacterized protein (TIGR02145 family)
MKKINSFLILSLIVIGLVLMANKCEKDPEDEEEIPTITDIDGNEYEIFEIGTQWWMAENLKTTKYNNGDLIGTSTPADLDLFHLVYDGGTPPKYQWPYNGVESNAIVYGRLYTWYAITDPRGVCPTGWHVPSNDEWLELQTYLIDNGFNYDGTITENKIAKAMAALTSWNSSTYEGSAGNTDYPGKRNASGFSGLAAGIRFADGEFAGLGESTNWFTSTNYYDDYDGIFWGFVFFNTSWGLSAGTNHSEEDALSVRCIKN